VKNSKRVTAAFVSAALAGSMALTSGQAAAATTQVRSAAPTTAAVSALAVSSAGVTAPLPASGSPANAPAPQPGTVDAPPAATALAFPWAIRLAVKAALAAVKRTSVSTYNTIIGYVLRGRTAFVNWWNTSVPTWVKNLFGGISAAAIYDAIRWIIGI
jgi:hypothetical protein